MKKIFLSALLMLTVIMSTIAVPVSAATVGLYTYTVTDGKATITDVDTSIYGLSGKVTVPSTLGGYPVVAIGNRAYSSCTKMKNVIIPNTITSIGERAFYDCSGMVSITIPDSVTTIGGDAFGNCSSLTAVNINSIEAWLNIEFSSFSVSNPLFYAKELYVNGELVTDLIIPDGVTAIKPYAFYHYNSLTSVTIPESVTKIEVFAFSGCNNLASINIPDSITSIGKYTFYNCTSLTNIVIPDSITSIGEYTFYGCTNLETITIPSSVTYIDSYAFFNCKALKTVNYTGSEEEWCIIYIGSENNYLHSADIILNYNVANTAIAKITNAEATNSTLKFVSETQIEGNPEISAFGTTFIPLWLFETGSGDVATVEYDNEAYDIQNGQTFGATLTGIPESCKDMAIVGKSYIKDSDGNYTWSDAKSASINDTKLNSLK